jgi:hypothetical protein
MSDHDVEDKFRRLVAGELDRTRARKVIDLVWHLDEVKDISTLMPLLRAKRES